MAEGDKPAFSGPPGTVVTSDSSLPRNAQARNSAAHSERSALTAASAAGEVIATAKQEALERADHLKEVQHAQRGAQAPQIVAEPKFVSGQQAKTAPGVQANPGNKIMDGRRTHYGQPQGKGTS